MFGDKKKREKAEEKSRVRAMKMAEEAEIANGSLSGSFNVVAPSRKDRVVSTILSPYAPRQSARASSNNVSADNDKWVENYAVVEIRVSNKTKFTIRSFFQSDATGKREWDEPPSGASDIQYATSEMKRMAELQLEELSPASNESENGSGREKSRKKSFAKWMKKKNVTTKIASSSSNADADGINISNEKSMKSDLSKLVEKDYDRQMQLAIAMSLHGPNNVDPENGIPDLDMAKALSLSEQEASVKAKLEQEKDDEMLREVMELSKVDGGDLVNGVGSPRSKNSFDYVEYDEKENDEMLCAKKLLMEEADDGLKLPAILRKSSSGQDGYKAARKDKESLLNFDPLNPDGNKLNSGTSSPEQSSLSPMAYGFDPLLSPDISPKSKGDASKRRPKDKKWNLGNKLAPIRVSNKPIAAGSRSETTDLV